MKRALFAVLAVIMCVSLYSCGTPTLNEFGFLYDVGYSCNRADEEKISIVFHNNGSAEVYVNEVVRREFAAETFSYKAGVITYTSKHDTVKFAPDDDGKQLVVQYTEEKAERTIVFEIDTELLKNAKKKSKNISEHAKQTYDLIKETVTEIGYELPFYDTETEYFINSEFHSLELVKDNRADPELGVTILDSLVLAEQKNFLLTIRFIKHDEQNLFVENAEPKLALGFEISADNEYLWELINKNWCANDLDEFVITAEQMAAYTEEDYETMRSFMESVAECTINEYSTMDN